MSLSCIDIQSCLTVSSALSERSVSAINSYSPTHSPDIITASLDHSVVFIAPPNVARPNQAVQLREDDETSRVLHLIGQSVGVISLGKRIVLIEGTESSLDKQTYGSIVGSQYPDLVLVPVGGKESIASFVKAFETVLNKTVWGVDFFMLCDGDTSTSLSYGADGGGRLRLLPRYHIENYFLDERVLVRLFEALEEVVRGAGTTTTHLSRPLQHQIIASAAFIGLA